MGVSGGGLRCVGFQPAQRFLLQMKGESFMTLTANPKLCDWAAYWLETYVRPVAKPSGYEHYHDNLHKHILPKLGDLRLNKLTPSVVQRFLNDVAEHGNLRNGGPLSAKSIKNMRVVLDVCCKRAVAEGYMQANPVPLTVYKHCTSKPVDVMSDEDQRILEEWLFQDPSLMNAGIIMALYNGMRLGEVCAARWRNYDFYRGCLHVEETVRRISTYQEDAEYGQKTRLVFSEAKTAASRRDLYFPDVLRDLMALQYERFEKITGRAPGPNDFIIYNSEGGLMDPDNLSHYFGDVLHGLGLKHIKYHALRHTFASRSVENGIDVATVSGILGHADVTTTTHYYVHPREEAMRRAMGTIRPITPTYTRPNVRIPQGVLPCAGKMESVPQRVCRRRKHVAKAEVA